MPTKIRFDFRFNCQRGRFYPGDYLSVIDNLIAKFPAKISFPNLGKLKTLIGYLIYQIKMSFNTPTSTVLYSIEEAIKAYRKLSQQHISHVVSDITVDQALILLILEDNDKTQTEIADIVFKDYASMTRIIKLMINKNYLIKTVDNLDRRKAKLEITEIGEEKLKKLKPIIKKNREVALGNISDEELKQLYKTLNKITQNCKPNT